MIMVWRILSLAGLFILAIFVTPLLSVPAALWYAARWYAPELIVFGLFIDIYFGAAAAWPFYTAAAGAIVLAAELSKRYLMIK